MRLLTATLPAAASSAYLYHVQLGVPYCSFPCGHSLFALAVPDANIAILISHNSGCGEFRLISLGSFFLCLLEDSSLAASEFSFGLAYKKQVCLQIRKKDVHYFLLHDPPSFVQHFIYSRYLAILDLDAQRCLWLPSFLAYVFFLNMLYFLFHFSHIHLYRFIFHFYLTFDFISLKYSTIFFGSMLFLR